jgi:hypothetical protein
VHPGFVSSEEADRLGSCAYLYSVWQSGHDIGRRDCCALSAELLSGLCRRDQLDHALWSKAGWNHKRTPSNMPSLGTSHASKT